MKSSNWPLYPIGRASLASALFAISAVCAAVALAANSAGETYRFEYQESHGVNRIAWTTNCTTKVTAGVTGLTSNAQWMVQNPAKPNADGPYDWLTYQGTDGSQWQARLHCKSVSASGDSIDVWLQQRKTNGSADHDDNMVVIDWQGGKWEVAPTDIRTHSGSQASQPVKFRLSAKPANFQ